MPGRSETGPAAEIDRLKPRHCLKPRDSAMSLTRWSLIVAAALLLAAFATPATPADAAEKPNIVILFADDMGYGDLSSYGHPRIETPNIDGLAADGMRFKSFVTGSWCVPSRTQLMTGRYLPRVRSAGGDGLLGGELTMAQALERAGYATGMAGKWHLGFRKDKYLPVNKGFDSWLGTARSNDFRKPWVQTDVPLGMYRGTEMVEHPLNQDTLTTRYTAEAVEYIESQADRDQPFFFYLAYNMPHLPIHTTERFRGSSDAGLYGDVIETIDWSVGRVLDALEEQGMAENTIVFFASDNGPWLDLPDRMLQGGNKPWHAGSPGPLRGHKATTYEGGVRVPAMIRWPGKIEPGQESNELVGMPDIYRTCLEVAGAELPDHPLDGHNLVPFLTGEVAESPRQRYYYIRGRLQAMRDKKWKLRIVGDEPQLFNMVEDPFERFNRAEEKPEIVSRMRQQMKAFAEEVGTRLAD
jgi:arylsulfatase A-like enzyme